jgi:alkylation response protein AidB-like acyl-CoA dehydrogenase
MAATGIGFDAELELLRRETRRTLAERFPMRRVRAAIDAPPQADVLRERAAHGWTGALIDQAHGGGGATLTQVSVIAEEHGRALFGASLESTAAIATLLAGSAQHSERLQALDDGSMLMAWAGADLDAITATPTSGGLRLDGLARAVQDAELSDTLLVTARTDPDGGTIHALVDASAAGIERRPLRMFDVTRRYAEVTLDDVDVASADIIDDPAALQAMLDAATVLTCADATGAARALTEMSVQYAKERVTWGRPIASYQAIKHKCADMLVAVEGCEVVTRWAALAVDAHDPDAQTAVSIAKAYVSDAASMVAGESQQIHGGIGFTWEHDVHLYLRRIKADAVLFGSAAWHRERVAQAVIGSASGDAR